MIASISILNQVFEKGKVINGKLPHKLVKEIILYYSKVLSKKALGHLLSIQRTINNSTTIQPLQPGAF